MISSNDKQRTSVDVVAGMGDLSGRLMSCGRRYATIGEGGSRTVAVTIDINHTATFI